MSSTRRFTIDKPRPVPPNWRVVEASTCENGWNSASCRALRNADAGVAHFAAEQRALSLVDSSTLHVDGHFALLGELHGVAAEVDENLTQARRVALDELGQLRIHDARELQALAVRLDGEQPRHVLDGVAQVEVDVLEIELARFDLGEVENVVDDREQRRGAVADRLGVVALVTDRAPVSSSSSVMPITPFIGVRISWLMFARNSPLARFAAAEDSRASMRSCWYWRRSVTSCKAPETRMGRPGASFSQIPRERNQRYSPLLVRTRNSASYTPVSRHFSKAACCMGRSSG